MVSNSHDVQFLDSFILFLFCVVISIIRLLSCSVFQFAWFDFSFSFIISLAIKIFNYFTNFRSNICFFFLISLTNCVISSSIFLIVFLRLLFVSCVTILVLLHLSAVLFFVAVLFCLLWDTFKSYWLEYSKIFTYYGLL